MRENGAKARILLVENERSLAAPLARALTRAGYATATVPDGASALALATRHAFDLVVLDGALPDTNGHELCDTIHERTGTPIVMLAESVGEADRDAWSDGAEDYIIKPVRTAEAIARVRGVLRRVHGNGNGNGNGNGHGGGEILRVGPLVLDTITHRARLEGR
jgi:DNA-binding response OmpR family regulator